MKEGGQGKNRASLLQN
uniref:Uncharacterized protein n=1 Tax=Anguilla anguilla TaxID=7936 RepID=A0A0E9VU91_ANGAN